MFINKIEGKIYGDSLRKEIEDLADGKYKIEIESLDTRNLQQNALIWWWTYPHVQELFKRTGLQLTIEQLHEYYKYQFLRKRKKCPITHRFKFREWSTRKLSKKAFSEYLDKINNDCIEKFNEWIPSCDEMKDLYY